MNKFMLLGVLVIFMLMITYLSADALGSDSSGIRPPEGDANDASGVIQMLRAYINLMTFSIEEVPSWFTAFIIYPINFVIGYMVLDLVRG